MEMDVQLASPVVSKKAHWKEAEDAILLDYVKKHGEGKWNAVAKATGLARCGKSCRSRWILHLKPNLKKGPITLEEEQLIGQLHAKMGNKWAYIVKHLPGRTDNEIKNFWNCKMRKFKSRGVDVPLASPAPVWDPSSSIAHHQQRQRKQQYERSPPADSSFPQLVGGQCSAAIVPLHGVAVPDIVAQYLHSRTGAIEKVMENSIRMLQSRGIRIPDSLPRVPAPSPPPMTSTVDVDPEAPHWARSPVMPQLATVDPLAPPQLPIAAGEDRPTPLSPSMNPAVSEHPPLDLDLDFDIDMDMVQSVLIRNP